MYLYVSHMYQHVFCMYYKKHYRGTLASFSPSVGECWYGRVNLIFKMRVRTDSGSVMECQCALIETLFDYCPREGRVWWPSTAEIGTKLLYMLSPEPVVCIIPLSHILGRLPLLLAGDFDTIPRSMSRKKAAVTTVPAVTTMHVVANCD